MVSVLRLWVVGACLAAAEVAAVSEEMCAVAPPSGPGPPALATSRCSRADTWAAVRASWLHRSGAKQQGRVMSRGVPGMRENGSWEAETRVREGSEERNNVVT